MNMNPEVDAWFAEYEHPAKDSMLRVREIVLSDHRMEETIKWKSPTLITKGIWPASIPAPRLRSV